MTMRASLLTITILLLSTLVHNRSLDQSDTIRGQNSPALAITKVDVVIPKQARSQKPYDSETPCGAVTFTVRNLGKKIVEYFEADVVLYYTDDLPQTEQYLSPDDGLKPRRYLLGRQARTIRPNELVEFSCGIGRKDIVPIQAIVEDCCDASFVKVAMNINSIKYTDGTTWARTRWGQIRSRIDVEGARPVRVVEPEYPAMPYIAHANGRVIVRVALNDKGEVVSAKAEVGHIDLRGGAERAARECRFIIERPRGKAEQAEGTITYSYQM